MDEKVRVGSQANNYNGVRPGLGPVPGYGPCTAATPAGAPCLVMSPPGQNLWPQQKLSDDGFESEQKFQNVMLLDAYVYGSFALGNSDLQVRLGNQVINWGESVFIQGVNQINPIDVPAARRAGAELKEILLPVWAAYANWGFNWGSVEAFYQLQWNNTSVDGCGTYFTTTSTLISAHPASCNSITVVGGQLGNLAPGTSTPTIPQLGSQPFLQANGTYVPAVPGQGSRATTARSASPSASRWKSSTPNSACTPCASTAGCRTRRAGRAPTRTTCPPRSRPGSRARA